MEATFDFVPYGEDLQPLPDTMVLDVGMKTVPGVIDHHQPDAEPECTASLIIRHPGLVLDHLKSPEKVRFITHRFPDFDALSSIFLASQLLELGGLDAAMERIARYARMADSASLPKEINLAATPYAILRGLFSGAKKEEAEINRDRVREGIKFMRFLYGKTLEGYDIEENRVLFSGVERYERAARKVEGDYFHYLDDLGRSRQLTLDLPLSREKGKKRVDGLVVRNPSSFLLKEWARRDLNAPSLGQGYSLLVTNFGAQRHILGVDPDKGVNLKGLGGLLNQREAETRKEAGKAMPFRWYEGNCPFFDYRIIDSPQDGSILSQQDVVDLLLAFSDSLL
jgi:hypothetical protein